MLRLVFIGRHDFVAESEMAGARRSWMKSDVQELLIEDKDANMDLL
jgi:hypothetical protein